MTIAQRLEKLVQTGAWFTTGFVVPASVVGYLLWSDHKDETNWSGLSPLEHLPWIPVAFCIAALLVLGVRAMRGRYSVSRGKYCAAGFIGGCPLLLFSHETASRLAGAEVPLLAASYAAIIVLALGNLGDVASER